MNAIAAFVIAVLTIGTLFLIICAVKLSGETSRLLRELRQLRDANRMRELQANALQLDAQKQIAAFLHGFVDPSRLGVASDQSNAPILRNTGRLRSITQTQHGAQDNRIAA